METYNLDGVIKSGAVRRGSGGRVLKDDCGGSMETQWKNTCWYHALSNAFHICVGFQNVVSLWSAWIENAPMGSWIKDTQGDLDNLRNAMSIDEQNKVPLHSTDGTFINTLGDKALGHPRFMEFILSRAGIRTLSIQPTKNEDTSSLLPRFYRFFGRPYIPNPPGNFGVSLSQAKGIWLSVDYGHRYAQHLRRVFTNQRIIALVPAEEAAKKVGFFGRVGSLFSRAEPAESSQPKIIRDAFHAFERVHAEFIGPHAVAFSPNGIDASGFATWCYMDSQGWLVQNVSEHELYDFLSHPTILYVIFELPNASKNEDLDKRDGSVMFLPQKAIEIHRDFSYHIPPAPIPLPAKFARPEIPEISKNARNFLQQAVTFVLVYKFVQISMEKMKKMKTSQKKRKSQKKLRALAI